MKKYVPFLFLLFSFSANSQIITFRAEEYKTKGGQKTVDEICEKYGSEKVGKTYSARVLR